MSLATEAASRRSSKPRAKIFGIPLGVDPKILVGALIAIAATLFWFNSRNDDNSPVSATPVRPQAVNATPVAPISRSRAASLRRRAAGAHDDHGTLRLRAIDATRGDVDPVLRLDLLERMQTLQPASMSRNLFESGAGPTAADGGPLPVRTIMPGPKPTVPVTPQYPAIVQPTANIPLRYYGFAKPSNPGEGNRGFFLNGEHIVMAAEGELVQQRYLIVQLTPANARVEDTQVKLGQTLPVIPATVEQQ